MPEPSESRVGVYIDFDNVVISRYDQLFGRGDFMRDRARDIDGMKDRLEEAKVDIGAILDYASSFGTIAVSRAYADWSAPANSAYQRQLINRAVDLAQLFQVTSGGKNGADIRLAVDVVEELYRLPDLTHVVLVAGDSDYIALAQSAKRLGRTVIGIGVAGATSRALMAACDEFTDYDEVPGVVPVPKHAPGPSTTPKRRNSRSSGAQASAAASTPEPEAEPTQQAETEPDGHLTQEAATDLLIRALRIVESRGDEDWAGNSQVKNQMLRMDSSFKEKSLGYKSFTAFVDSRAAQVEVKEGAPTNQPRLRLRAEEPATDAVAPAIAPPTESAPEPVTRTSRSRRVTAPPGSASSL
ncbi:NYN domain-containing protein [soil metagenome]